jgi:hypothetical protein
MRVADEPAIGSRSQPTEFDTITRLLLGVLGVISIIIIAHRMRLAGSVLPMNYNEGWNAFHALRFLQTGTPYPPMGGLTANNYPPLWFPLVAVVGHFTGSLIFAARLVALAGFFLLLLFCAAIGRQIGGKLGSFAAAIVVAAIFSTQADFYIGIADPQFLAQAVSAFALLLAVRSLNALDNRYLWAIGLAVFAGFFKHNLVALPTALLVAALLEGRAAARRALLAAMGALVAGYLISAAFGGMSWPLHLFSARTYSLSRVAELTVPFIILNAMGMVLGIAGLKTLPRGHVQRVLTGLLVVTLPAAALFVGGEGVSTNIFFDSMVAIGLCASLLVGASGYFPSVQVQRFPASLPPWWAGATVALWLVVAGLPGIRDNVHKFRFDEPLELRTARFQSDVNYLRSLPGAVICDSPALCYLAGKAFIYDPFNAQQVVRTGAMSADQVRKLIQAQYVQVYHVPPPYLQNVPPEMIADVTANFVVARQNEDGLFLVRRGNTSPH